MQPGLAASTIAHAGILVLTLVSFTGAKPFEPMPESMPVDVISATDFTKLTKGAKTAPKLEKPQQVAEKVAEPTPVEDPKLKVSKDAPVEATTPPPPAPAPAPKMMEEPPVPPKPVEAPPKPPAPQKAQEAPPKVEPKVDEALKSEPKKDDRPKEDQPKEEAKLTPAPLPPKKPAPPRPVEAQQTPSREFNTDQIKDLIDKRTPTRQVASASQTSTTTSLGAPSGQAATLSMSEIDAFRARMRQCWNTTGIPPAERVFVEVRVDFNPDGTLRVEPSVIGGSASTYGPAVARTAVAALVRCQPFTMFRKETYAQWKSMDLTFRPQEFER